MDFNEWLAYHQSSSETSKSWTSSEIDSLFHLDEKKKDTIKNLEYTIFELQSGHRLKPCTLETIQLSQLVGTCRSDDATNWLDLLYGLTKLAHFDNFSTVQNHYNFVNCEYDEEDFIGMPEVVEKDGVYYINSNGKHRLTIAKCLGIETAIVHVQRLK